MNLQTKEILAEMGDDTLETAHNLEVLLGYQIDAAYGTLNFGPRPEMHFYCSIIGPGFVICTSRHDDFKLALDRALEHEGVTPTMLRMKAELKGYS